MRISNVFFLFFYMALSWEDIYLGMVIAYLYQGSFLRDITSR